MAVSKAKADTLKPKKNASTRKRAVLRPKFRIPPPVFQGFKKKYYCLYCKNSYKGTPKTVKNHESAHSHKNNVKKYYLNKFLQLYDRSHLKAKGNFKLGNDFNRFENTILNNVKMGIQFMNNKGLDAETGSDLLSKVKFLNSRDVSGIPNFILRRRSVQRMRDRQQIKNKINERKRKQKKAIPITNKDKQQLHEAKQTLKQLNYKKRNSYKKYQLKKKRKKLLKILNAGTDSNLNLNYNFGGDRKGKYDYSLEDNGLQILNHIYKKSPNYNRIFLAKNADLNLWDIRERFLLTFNDRLKARKLKSLKSKIAKVKKRIQVKRKYGKRKFNPNFKKTESHGKSMNKLWLSNFNRSFDEETYLKHLKLKFKKINNITKQRKEKFAKRESEYKLFNENIKAEKFLQKVQQEKNKYTNSLLLPPRTLNVNSNSVNFSTSDDTDIISFPLNSRQKQQKLGPIPDWLLKHSSNKLLSRKLFYPRKKDLDGISSVMYNYLQKSKKLKHLIKQSLYKQQNIKSMFKYQGFLWKNYRKRNSFYKMNNNITQKAKIIKLLQLKTMGKHWFNKIYGQREGKFRKLNRLTRYKEIRDKKLKYKKTIHSNIKTKGSKVRIANGKKIIPVKQKPEAEKKKNLSREVKSVEIKQTNASADNVKHINKGKGQTKSRFEPSNRMQTKPADAKTNLKHSKPQSALLHSSSKPLAQNTSYKTGLKSGSQQTSRFEQTTSRFQQNRPQNSRFQQNSAQISRFENQQSQNTRIYQPSTHNARFQPDNLENYRSEQSNLAGSRFEQNKVTTSRFEQNKVTTSRVEQKIIPTSRYEQNKVTNTDFGGSGNTNYQQQSARANTGSSAANSRFSNTRASSPSGSGHATLPRSSNTRPNNASNQSKSYRSTTNPTKSRFQG